MNTRDLLKARLATVRRDFDDVLGHLSDGLLPWSPAEGLRTVSEQLFCVAGKEIELLHWTKKKGESEWVEVEMAQFGGRENSVDGWKSIFFDARKKTLSILDTLSDVDLEAPVKFPEDWWEGLRLTELPMHECFRTIAFHEWHHAGQLIPYLSLKGDDPNSR